MKIIFDSNAFFVPLQFKIEVFEEIKNLLNANFEPIVLSHIQRELQTLAEKGSPKMRKLASFALKLTEKCTFVDYDGRYASPDDAIFEAAKAWRCLVFTNDRTLRKRLKNIKVPVIYVRQKSHLEIDGRM